MKVFEKPLPTYISGFFPQDYEKEPFDLDKFLQQVFTDSKIDFSKAVIDRQSSDHTYILVKFKYDDVALLLLSHKYFPVMAISKNNFGSFEFLDIPELVEAFFQKSVKVLSKATLETPVNGHHPTCVQLVKDLADIEFAEFAFYEPKYISDIVFNRWKK
ncbi:hypothetical protein [Sediminitomix flava]|uniref:Uncharacterized protein n=1 Tax=Sediminitomix flava TaxID=379075 RepID=A0A315ZFU2_SEDFL|nr:hypothetical protein [Sediminitomix flava]PWJ44456.1 hypothetical protein BC781_101827 [Sediminitomix flava]